MNKENPSSIAENDDFELELPMTDGCLGDDTDEPIDDLDELGLGNIGDDENVGLDVSTGCDPSEDDFELFNISEAEESQSWCVDCESSDELFGTDEDLLQGDENGWLDVDETNEQLDWLTDDLINEPPQDVASQEDNGEEGIEEFVAIDEADDETSLPPLDMSEDEDSDESDSQDELDELLLKEIKDSEYVRNEGGEG